MASHIPATHTYGEADPGGASPETCGGKMECGGRSATASLSPLSPLLSPSAFLDVDIAREMEELEVEGETLQHEIQEAEQLCAKLRSASKKQPKKMQETEQKLERLQRLQRAFAQQSAAVTAAAPSSSDSPSPRRQLVFDVKALATDGNVQLRRLEQVQDAPLCVEVAMTRLLALTHLAQAGAPMPAVDVALGSNANTTDVAPSSGSGVNPGADAQSPPRGGAGAGGAVAAPISFHASAGEGVHAYGETDDSCSNSVVVYLLPALLQLERALAAEHADHGEASRLLAAARTALLRDDMSGALDFIKQLCTSMIGLDVLELLRLIELQRGVARMLVQRGNALGNENKVYLLLGESGAGKTSALFKFAGCTMRSVTQEGMMHIEPAHVPAHLAELRSRADCVSITSHLTPVTVKLADLDIPIDRDMLFIDAPGQNDSRSAELDVANGAGILMLARSCAAVKPIIFISSEDWGSRSGGLRAIAHELVLLLHDVSKHADALSFVYTRFQAGSEEHIKGRILNVIKREKDGGGPKDHAFMDLLEAMAVQPKHIVDLFAPREETGKLLLGLIKQPCISEPHSTFKSLMGAGSRETLSKEVDKLCTATVVALQARQVTKATWRLQQLTLLADALPVELQPALDACCHRLHGELLKVWQDAQAVLARLTSQRRPLGEVDARTLVQCWTDLVAMDGMRAHRDMPANTPSAELLARDIMDFATQAASFVKGALQNPRPHHAEPAAAAAAPLPPAGSQAAFSNQGVQLELADAERQLHGVQLLRQELARVGAEIVAEVTRMLSEVDQLVSLAQQAVVERSLSLAHDAERQSSADGLAALLTTLRQLCQLFHRHLPPDHFEHLRLQACTTLLEQLGKDVQECQRPLGEQQLLTDEHISAITQCCTRLSQTRHHRMLQSLLGERELERLDSLCTGLQCVLVKAFVSRVERAEHELRSSQGRSATVLRNIRPAVEELLRMRRVPQLADAVADKFHALASSVVGFVKELQRTVDEITARFGAEPALSSAGGGALLQLSQAEANRLTLAIRGLQEAKWVEQLQANVCTKAMVLVQEQLGVVAEEMARESAQLQLSLTHESSQEELDRAMRLYSQIRALSELESLVPQVGESRACMEQRLQNMMTEAETLVREAFDLESVSKHARKAQLRQLDEVIETFYAATPVLLYLQKCNFRNMPQLDDAIRQAEEQHAALLEDNQEMQQSRQRIHLLAQQRVVKSSEPGAAAPPEWGPEERAMWTDLVQQHSIHNRESLERAWAAQHRHDTQLGKQADQARNAAEGRVTELRRIRDECNSKLSSSALTPEQQTCLVSVNAKHIQEVEEKRKILSAVLENLERERQSYAFGALDAALVHRLLWALECIEIVPASRVAAQSLTRRLRNFLQCFAESMGVQFVWCLEQVSQCKSTTSSHAIRSWCTRLANCLHDVEHFRQHAKVFAFFGEEFVKQRTAELHGCHLELLTRMSDLHKHQRHSELDHCLRMVRALMHLEGRSGFTLSDCFSKLFKEYSSFQVQNLGTAVQIIHNAIHNCDFQLVQDKIVALEPHAMSKAAPVASTGAAERGDSEDAMLGTEYQNKEYVLLQVSPLLSQVVSRVCDEAERSLALLRSPADGDTSKVEAVRAQLAKMREAHKCVRSFLNDATREKLDTACRTLPQQLEAKMQQWVRVFDKAVESAQFVNALDMLAQIRQVHDQLGVTYNSELLLSESAAVHKAVHSRVAEFKAKPLSQYDHRLDRILKELNALDERHGLCADDLSQLEGFVRNQFRSHVDGLMQCSANERALGERTARKALRVLQQAPSLLMELQEYLDQANQKFNDLISDYEDELNRAIANRNGQQAEELAKLHDKFSSAGLAPLVKQLEDKTLALVQDQKGRVDDEIASLRTAHTFENLRKYLRALTRFDDSLGSRIESVSSTCQHAKDAYLTLCDEQREHIVHLLKELAAAPITAEIRAKLEQATQVFVDSQTTPASETLHVELSSDAVQQVHEALLIFLKRTQTKFEEACRPKLNCGKLQQALDATTQLEPLHRTIKKYAVSKLRMGAPAKGTGAAAQHARSAGLAASEAKARASAESVLSELHGCLDNVSKDRLVTQASTRVQALVNDARKLLSTEPAYDKLAANPAQLFDEQYQQFSQMLDQLDSAHLLSAHIQMTQKDLHAELMQQLRAQLQRRRDRIQSQLSKTSGAPLESDDFDALRAVHCSFTSCLHHVPMVSDEVRTHLDAIKQAVFVHVHRIGAECVALTEGGDPELFALHLIGIKRLSQNIGWLKTDLDRALDDVVEKYRTRNAKDAQALGQVAVVLGQHPIGRTVVEEHKGFKAAMMAIWNECVSGKNIKYVTDSKELAECTSDATRAELKKQHDLLMGMFQSLVDEQLNKGFDVPALVSRTLRLAAATKAQQTLDARVASGHVVDIGKWWSKNVSKAAVEVLASLFALWTVKRSSAYGRVADFQDKKGQDLLTKPHAGQIVAIFRLLGIGDMSGRLYSSAKHTLENHLVQIGTGEGKSVTLAMVAMTLALFGAEVDCVCYSANLSERDRGDFTDLFDLLGVSERIRYSTFGACCERQLNDGVDMREAIKKVALGDSLTKSHNGSVRTRPRILLIDEVDVFFSNDFYGATYNPVCLLQDDTIELMFREFHKAGAALTAANAAQQPAYQAVLARFPSLQRLLSSMIPSLVSDRTITKQYVVDRKRGIGYREHDGVNFNSFYGFETAYAALAEESKGTLSAKVAACSLGLKVRAGQFSFAEVPKQFDRILGVTATLATLSQEERAIMRDEYEIELNTCMPSSFGANNIDFRENDYVRVEVDADWHTAIKEEMARKLRADGGERAVIIFFETAKEVEAFAQSEVFRSYAARAQALTESTPVADRAGFIKNATCEGAITLAVASYARGVDFACRSSKVIQRMGVHVLCTYLPPTVADEMQAKGRTARQGKPGSFSMVLRAEDLSAHFDVKQEDITDARNRSSLYTMLAQKRAECCKKRAERQAKAVQNAKANHEATMKLKQHVLQGRTDAVLESMVNL